MLTFLALGGDLDELHRLLLFDGLWLGGRLSLRLCLDLDLSQLGLRRSLDLLEDWLRRLLLRLGISLNQHGGLVGGDAAWATDLSEHIRAILLRRLG